MPPGVPTRRVRLTAVASATPLTEQHAHQSTQRGLNDAKVSGDTMREIDDLDAQRVRGYAQRAKPAADEADRDASHDGYGGHDEG
ncbi:MAG: hypothetical protein L0H24_02980 [Microlunatus sp.]|nr:hypothetical protein [Microlunatus sp.]